MLQGFIGLISCGLARRRQDEETINSHLSAAQI